MAFGISTAPDESQRLVHDTIGDLDGVETIADDLLVVRKKVILMQKL